MNVQRHTLLALSVFVLLTGALAGCSDDARPHSEAKRNTLQDASQSTLREMQAKDPDLQNFLNRGYAYALFPNVGKGGFIVGGAHGDGLIYQNGNAIGWADIKQASVGAQAGGQTFAELLVFENQAAFDKFRNNELSLEANASAVALTAGASKGAVFRNGVAVFTMPKGGAMLEAAVGGQRFTFTPMGEQRTTETRTERTDIDTRTNRTDTNTGETRTKVEVKTQNP
jgi:lipid-binding SYLF domain-containing protein